MIEEFRDVPGYEGCYQVSNFGNLKSLPRVVLCKNGVKKNIKGIMKSQTLNKSRGYYYYSLQKDGKTKTIATHVLVAMGFLGHKQTGCIDLCVDHIDNNKLNNNISNLQVISHRENMAKDRTGTSKHTGVCWHKSNRKWYASISINGKTVNLGSYEDELDAKHAYDRYKNSLL